jgi:hypothetical protein
MVAGLGHVLLGPARVAGEHVPGALVIGHGRLDRATAATNLRRPQGRSRSGCPWPCLLVAATGSAWSRSRYAVVAGRR